ncbi:MAG: 4Fe-4S dicluster domain-containing protein [Deltaproteobacteria bacterium]|nr:4Fe-4S dicluster domain-containing protein [Deltaproteobacteria bacterium]
MQIDSDKCSGCGGCVNLCPNMAIYFVNNQALIDRESCSECRTCFFVCGRGAPFGSDAGAEDNDDAKI